MLQSISVLVSHLTSEKEETQYRAAVALLERGFGKPTEYTEIDVDGQLNTDPEGLKKYSDDDLKRLLQLIQP